MAHCLRASEVVLRAKHHLRRTRHVRCRHRWRQQRGRGAQIGSRTISRRVCGGGGGGQAMGLGFGGGGCRKRGLTGDSRKREGACIETGVQGRGRGLLHQRSPFLYQVFVGVFYSRYLWRQGRGLLHQRSQRTRNGNSISPIRLFTIAPSDSTWWPVPRTIPPRYLHAYRQAGRQAGGRQAGRQ